MERQENLLSDFMEAVNKKVVKFPDLCLEFLIRETIGKPEGDIYAGEIMKFTNFGTGLWSINKKNKESRKAGRYLFHYFF